MMNNKTGLSAPLEVAISINNSCNLNCSYCFNKKSESDGENLSIKILRSFLKECKNAGILNISITGGEPFYRSNVFDILDEIPKNISFVIKSNGTLIDKSYARKLKNYDNLKSVGVSLDGPSSSVNDKTRGKGVFKQVLNSLKNLNKSGICFGIMTTVNRNNMNKIQELIKFGEKVNAKNVSFNRPIYAGSGKATSEFMFNSNEIAELAFKMRDLYKKYGKFISVGEWLNRAKLEELKEKFINDNYKNQNIEYTGCDMGSTCLYVKSNGDVTPCSFISDFSCGNIKDESLLDIWKNSKNLNKIREENGLRKAHEDKVCATECKFSPICPPGCFANSYSLFGHFKGFDPFNCFANKSASSIKERIISIKEK